MIQARIRSEVEGAKNWNRDWGFLRGGAQGRVDGTSEESDELSYEEQIKQLENQLRKVSQGRFFFFFFFLTLLCVLVLFFWLGEIFFIFMATEKPHSLGMTSTNRRVGQGSSLEMFGRETIGVKHCKDLMPST